MNLSWNLTYIFRTNDEFYTEIEKVNLIIFQIKYYEKDYINENSLLEMLNLKWRIKELSNSIFLYGLLMYYKV